MDHFMRGIVMGVLGVGLISNIIGLVWIVRHVIRSRKEGTL